MHRVIYTCIIQQGMILTQDPHQFAIALISLLGFPLAATFSLPWQIATTVCRLVLCMRTTILICLVFFSRTAVYINITPSKCDHHCLIVVFRQSFSLTLAFPTNLCCTYHSCVYTSMPVCTVGTMMRVNEGRQ